MTGDYFIQLFIQGLNKEDSNRFLHYYQEAIRMPENQLYLLLEKHKATYYTTGHRNLSNLMTCGCQHRVCRDYVLAGCSMCNLHNKSLDHTAYMTAMRERNEVLYSQLVKLSFLNARGTNPSRTIHEYLFSYDFLNEREIPDICLEMLLGKNGIYKRKPFVYEFETAARSITWKRLKLLKQYTKDAKVIIRIGIECADEWIRNHWLIKNISNDDIIKAIKACKEFGFEVTGNVLLGLPGFTEENSITEFINSVEWLDEIEIDSISCSILDRYENTLQGYIYDSLRTNSVLAHYGIADGDHTGLPWLFSFVRALAALEKNRPSVIRKIVFGQFVTNYIDGEHTVAYNYSPFCLCANYISQFISKGFIESTQSISNLENEMKQDSCYSHYLKLLDIQKKISSLEQNLRCIVLEVSKNFFQNWETYMLNFQSEFKDFKKVKKSFRKG